MKKRTTMLMSALFAAGAFALNGNVAKADNVQAVNNNNANSTEVKQNDENSSYNEIVKENTKYVAEQDNYNRLSKQYIQAFDLNEEKWKEKRAYDHNHHLDASDKADYYMPVLSGEEASGDKVYTYGGVPSEQDWKKADIGLDQARKSVDDYLNSAVQNSAQVKEYRNEAKDALENVRIPYLPLQDAYENRDAEWNSVNSIYGVINSPYIKNLTDARIQISNSDHAKKEGNYKEQLSKLAELVGRNVGKDKNWIIKQTKPIPDQPSTYADNKELITLDRNAFNRNRASAVIDASHTATQNNTTSKKDQSTTGTSNTSSNTNQTTENKSSTTSSKTTSDTKTPVAKNEGSAAKTTDVVKNENKATENTASVVKNDAKAATENTADVKVVAPAKNASNEVKTTDAAAKASDAHVVALNSKVNAGTTSTTPAAAAKDSQAKATENKLPQAGTDEKISLFASLAGLSIVSLGLGALGASKKRKND
ncbi:hypothetical protein HF870_03415 [Lactobacillus johnsonii]|uniref:hypothetical protein n=1 Tax=Lactobacillus johnsonii TaxID=33959 RepID=UPI001475038F|nr:hypothetical protein [Lactobacillus johnsonii]NME20216.1 hypothetical protein [Lactobacillus johnsonii]